MDNPGRQQVGSFNPLSPDDWTEMAYVSNTFTLCQAILDRDSEFVRAWLEKEGNDPNARDWTGRAPLHLAAANSTVEIVQLLIDHGARLVARLVDGRTALHLAATRGSAEIISALLRKSEANAEEEEQKIDARRSARKAAKIASNTNADVDMADASRPSTTEAFDEASDIDMVEDADDDENMDATTEQSMVNIRRPMAAGADDKALQKGEENDPDIYDVNVVAWDTAATALHLAIIKGHTDVVKCLVSEFGADILLPIKIFDEGSKTARAAVLTLVLALQLPLETAKEMTQALIALGATVAQADVGHKTALQYCVVHNPDLLDTYGVIDETGVRRAINHVTVARQSWLTNCSTPLLAAVQCRDGLTASKLLTSGAKGRIDFNSWIKVYEGSNTAYGSSKQNRDNFEKSQDQPIISAVACDLPEIAKKLIIEHGIDVNTLTRAGYDVLQNANRRNWQHGQTILDATHDKLASLRKWKPEEPDANPPVKLEHDDHYLAPFEEGTYARWSAVCQLNVAKKAYKSAVRAYEEAIESHKTKVGSAEKQAAIAKLIKEFETLESCLMERSAQSFSQLHPEITPPQGNSHGYYHVDQQPAKFTVQFSFKLPNLSSEAEQRYVKLFESVWAGDVESIKELTLMTWQDENDHQQPPLQVTAEDQDGISPLVIATLQGNFELVHFIMELARQQYAPPGAEKQRRFRMRNKEEEEEEDYDSAEGDDDDEDDDDDVHIESEIVDEEFTIDNVGQVSMQVQSRITPLMLLTRSNIVLSNLLGDAEIQSSNPAKGFSFFGPRNAYTLAGKRSNTGTMRMMDRNNVSLAPNLPKPSSLIQWALYTANLDYLVGLLNLGQKYLDHEFEDNVNTYEGKLRFFSIHDADFEYAIKVDRPELLEEITRRTGAGLPLRQLLARSGVEVPKEKPKHYQGLSVHGKKRTDWAAAGRNSMQAAPIGNHRPPLLEAAYAGSLKAAEWFSSNAPVRCYEEFAETHKDEKILQHLALAKGGFAASTEKFLSARSYLAIHSCLMGNKTSNNSALLKYLISSMPDSVDAKSRDGLTPLHIAFQLYDDTAVRLLIDAGADQTARDNKGNNIVHQLLRRARHEKLVKKLPQLLDLIDKRVLPSLMIERCSEDPGALTPLACFCADTSSADDIDAEILSTIIKYSGGEELSMINGEGDTPLHVAVRKDIPQFCKVILDHDPLLLHRENSTGRTPYEIAEDSSIMTLCERPPPMINENTWDFARVRAHRLGLTEQWNQDLLSRDASSFVENNEVDRWYPQEKVWDLVRRVKAQLDTDGHTGRRLVTLNEANEVARRLAAKQRDHHIANASYSGSNRIPGQDDYETKKDNSDAEQLPLGGDEVQVWLDMAEMSLQEADNSVFGSARGMKAPRT
nr:ankyrin repeat domain-containing protein 54 [Quercus suber]